MSGLSDLLQRLNTEGWSSRRIERETEKHGRKISYASVSRYLNGTHPQNPDAATLQALADVFGVHVNELRDALGRPGVGEPFDLGEDGARLTGPQREAIRTTVRLFVEQNDALADHAQQDGATTTAPSSDVDWALASELGLSQAQVEEALMMGNTLQEYARFVAHQHSIAQDDDAIGSPDPHARLRPSDFDRAADDSGPSLLEADDARAAARGEESQDPEDWR